MKKMNALSIFRPKQKPSLIKQVAQLDGIDVIEYTKDNGSRREVTVDIFGMGFVRIGGGQLPKEHIKVKFKQ